LEPDHFAAFFSHDTTTIDSIVYFTVAPRRRAAAGFRAFVNRRESGRCAAA
jgi:hypothetical protein